MNHPHRSRSIVSFVCHSIVSFFLLVQCIPMSIGSSPSIVLSSPRRGRPLNFSPQIWLSVSSKPQRKIVINWHRFDSLDNSSWIALYDHEPNRYNFHYSFLDQVQPRTSSGKFITSKPYEFFSFQSSLSGKSKRYLIDDFLTTRNDSKVQRPMTSLWNGCVKYWVALVHRSRRILLKKCLRTRPRWMEESMGQIGHRSVLELALPGTHNAGAYEVQGSRGFARVNKYIYCQDESIWNQLIYGIRFFDIRIAYDEKGRTEREKLWIAHGMMRLDIPFAEVLEQILAFLLSTTHEVIVLDIHRFEEGLEDHQKNIEDRHVLIERTILDYLGPYLVPLELGMGKPISELVAAGKRVFIGYARDKRNRRFFHTNALHVWPETDNAETLFRYLNERSCRSPAAPYAVSLMGALTPKFFGLLRDKYDGLRALAELVNHRLTVRLFEEWWQCMNVLSTDYFLGNNVIEYAIEANLQRERKL